MVSTVSWFDNQKDYTYQEMMVQRVSLVHQTLASNIQFRYDWSNNTTSKQTLQLSTPLPMRRWPESLSCTQVTRCPLPWTVLVYTCLPEKLLIALCLILKKSDLDYKYCTYKDSGAPVVQGRRLSILLSWHYFILTIIISIFSDEDLRLGKFKDFPQNPTSLNRNNMNETQA